MEREGTVKAKVCHFILSSSSFSFSAFFLFSLHFEEKCLMEKLLIEWKSYDDL